MKACGEKSAAVTPFPASSIYGHLRDVLANPAASHESPALFAEHIEKFTLERVSKGGNASLRLAARQTFSEKTRLHARMVPGARIELATPAFSGRRSTTELPRHDAHKV